MTDAFNNYMLCTRLMHKKNSAKTVTVEMMIMIIIITITTTTTTKCPHIVIKNRQENRCTLTDMAVP